MTRNNKEVGSLEEGHDTMVWSLSWHPLGHILVSGSNDHSTLVPAPTPAPTHTHSTPTPSH